MTVVGEVAVTRPYYYGPGCRAGHSPRDAALGLSAGDLTRGAAELAGAMGSFAEAADRTLPRLSGLHLSESTVERTTEAVGERLAAGRTFGPARADGRMAAVGMVWNPGAEGQVRYVCGMTGGLAGLGEPLRRQAAQVGLDRTDRWVAISDGGAGIEDWVRTHFPRVEAVILDFDHAAEHLSEWAKAVGIEGETAAWCHRLKHEGGQVVLAALEAVDVSARSEAAREVHRQVLGYFANQAHRMDDPALVDRERPGGGGVQAGGRPTAQGDRDASVRGGGRRRVPPAGVVPEREGPVGRLLGVPGRMTSTNTKDAHPGLLIG